MWSNSNVVVGIGHFRKETLGSGIYDFRAYEKPKQYHAKTVIFLQFLGQEFTGGLSGWYPLF